MGDVVMPAPASFQLSRTALWVHGLGLVFLAVSVAAFLLIGTADGAAMLGVGGAAWVVLSMWSIVLAVLSFRREGSSTWRMVFWMGLLFEVTAILALMWIYDYRSWHTLRYFDLLKWLLDLAFELCLPVLLMYLCISLCIALPLSARAAWSARPGLFRQRGLWIAAILAVLGVIVLPWAILTFCVSTLEISRDMAGGRERENKYDRRWYVGEMMPGFVCDAEEEFLQQSKISGATRLHLKLIECGFISKRRLEERIFDGHNDTASAACYAFQEKYRREAQTRAEELGGSSIGASRRIRARSFGRFLGGHASLADIRRVLDKDERLDPDFRSEILTYVVEERREEVKPSDFMADVIRLCAQDSRFCGMLDRCSFLQAKNFDEAWMKLFENKNWKFRDGLPHAFGLRESLTLLAHCMRDPSVTMRRQAISVLGNCTYCVEQKTLFVKALDDGDIAVRRAAAFHLSSEFGLRMVATPNEVNLMSQQNFTPAAPVPGEQIELESIRAAAQKWLKENSR